MFNQKVNEKIDAAGDVIEDLGDNELTYTCPRCGHTWTYSDGDRILEEALDDVGLGYNSADSCSDGGTTAKDYLIRYLKSNGYRYEINENSGHVSFKFEGIKYVFINNSGQLLMQICILFYDVNRSNRKAVLMACNEINSEKAMVKLTADEDTVWANWEDIVPEQGYDLGRIDMALNMLKDAFQRFYDIIGE